jgi:hypothetical protein
VISSVSITDSDRAFLRYSSVVPVEAGDPDGIAAAGMGAPAAAPAQERVTAGVAAR